MNSPARPKSAAVLLASSTLRSAGFVDAGGCGASSAARENGSSGVIHALASLDGSFEMPVTGCFGTNGFVGVVCTGLTGFGDGVETAGVGVGVADGALF